MIDMRSLRLCQVWPLSSSRTVARSPECSRFLFPDLSNEGIRRVICKKLLLIVRLHIAGFTSQVVL